MNQIKGISPEMSNKILNYVNGRAKSPEERQAMINDMLPEAVEYEKQQKMRTERDAMKNQLRERISKETRWKQANQLQFWLRSAILSDMVRDYARKSWGNVQGLDNDEELLNAFLAKNPTQAKTVERYLNWELSNLDIGKRLWFIQNGQTVEQEIQTPWFWRQAGQIGKDVVGGVLDSIVWLPKLAGKGIGNAIARTAKQFWANGQKVDALNQSWKDSLDGKNNLGLGSDLGQDQDSITYNTTNTLADIAQTAVPWGIVRTWAKGVQIANTTTKVGASLTKIFPKMANFINKTEKGADFVIWLINKAGGQVDHLTQKAPILWKMLKNGVEGISDTVLFNAVNWETTNLEEAWIGAGIGGALPVLWKALWWVGNKAKNLIGNSASKLELNGILNPAKLETIQQQLITEGSMLPWKATPQDVGKWMLERGFKGSKGDIVSQLNAHAQKSKSLVDELLSLSNSTHKVSEVNEALEMLAKDYSTTPGLTNKADEILGMIKSEYSLSEMNKVKRYLDDAYNMFNKNWTETAGLKAEGLRNIRQGIKKTIEEVAESEGLGNIRMLNNETQIARGLADGIGRKDKADIVRELLSPFSSARNGAILGGLGGGVNPNDSLPERIWNMAKWAIIGGILGSTKFKTNVANLLKNLGGIEKKEITQRIATNGVSKLSEKSIKTLEPVLEKVVQDWDLDDLISNIQRWKIGWNLAEGKYNWSNVLDSKNLINGEKNLNKGSTFWRDFAENWGSRIDGSAWGYNWASEWAIQGEFWSLAQSDGTSKRSIVSDNPTNFRDLTINLKNANPKWPFMDVHSIDEYANYKNFVSEDKQAVISVKPDGDIINFISNGKWAWKELMFSAIENWGNKMDNYWEWLVGYYERFWFEPVAKVKFNREYAPEGRDFEKFSEPYIYVMKHNWDAPWVVRSKYWSYPHKTMAELKNLPTMEYDEALAYRDSLLESRKMPSENFWSSQTKGAILANRKGYEGAKQELDNFLDELASTHNGKAIKTSLKFLNNDGSIREDGIKRILEKASKKKWGINEVNDIVRGTVLVKNTENLKSVVQDLVERGISFDDKFTNPTILGYKDISFNYPTSKGIKAETQINIPEMIVAKEWEDAVKHGMLDQATYDAIIKKAWVKGGLGHKYYEQRRALDEQLKNVPKSQQEGIERQMRQIEIESQTYYAKFK